MSSNRDSPSQKSTKRSNNKNRKNAAEYQDRVLCQVHEMFDSILEPDVILSVVQNCNWKLQPSIEHLITLSANINTSNEDSNLNSYKADFVEEEQGAAAGSPDSSPEEDAFEVDTDFTYLNINDEELKKQKEEFKKFQLMRKQGQDATRQWPLEVINDDVFFEKFKEQLFSSTDNKDTEDDFSYNSNQCPSSDAESFPREAYGNFHKSPNQENYVKTEERRKTETESLCGLKIQYRFGSPEASSDDDADVVIEEESRDHSISIPQNTPTNVCQFLSLSTESSPKTTSPQIEMISTASPSSSPISNQKFKPGFYATLNRIKSAIQNDVKIMVIIRGLPGSGKSYLAKNIAQSINDADVLQFIFSSDDFFMKKGKIYDFDPMKLSDAHAFNQQKVLKAVKDGLSPIIVDNTNTQCWEMRAYVSMAVQYGYFIEVLEPNTPWAFNVKELEKRNIHGVTKYSIERMLDRFEKNITGSKLLKMFSLKYESFNTPPQPCLPVSSPRKLNSTPVAGSNNTKAENKKCNRKNKKALETEEKSEDYAPDGFADATVVDAVTNSQNENLTALQLAIKTFGGDDDDLSPKENNQDLIQDKWDKDGDAWDDEQLEVDIKNKESDDLRATLNEESSCYRPFTVQISDNVKNIHEINEMHLNLGAIGSERKNSLVKNPTSNDFIDSDNKDILSPCWDFTVMMKEKQLNDEDPEKENEDTNKEKQNDDNFDNSNNSTSPSSMRTDNSAKSNVSEITKSPTEELKEAQNTLDKDSPDSGTKSSTTESFENIDSNSDDLLFEIRDTVDTKENTDCLKSMEETEKNDEILNTDPQAKVSFGSIMKFIKKSFMGTNNDLSKNRKSESSADEAHKTSEIVIDSLTEKLHSPVKEYNDSKVKKLDIEANLDSDLSDTLTEKLLRMGRKWQKDNKNLICEPQSNFKCIEFLETEIIVDDSELFDQYCSSKEISSEKFLSESFVNISDANNDSSEKEKLNDMDDEKQLAYSLSGSEDNIDEIYTKLESIKLTGPLARTVLSLEENEKLILEEKELVKSKVQKFDAELDLKTTDNLLLSSPDEDLLPIWEIPVKAKKPKKTDSTSQYHQTIDNINSISWKESPFPICEVEIPVTVEESEPIITSEVSTNTNFYDFNVLYIGGTNEQEYKVVDTFNRSINEGQVLSNLEIPPPRKLKLDKSSMTNEVDILLQLPTVSGEAGESDTEIIQGLIDMFPDIPQDYIVDVYQNLCKGNSDWAAEVLLDGIPSGVDLKGEPSKPVISENSSLHSSPSRKADQSKLSTGAGDNSPSIQARRKEKSHISEDSLALIKHLEEKMVISEASYHPHTLRVRKWKNGEPDASTEEIIEAQARSTDVLQFINDSSPVEIEATTSPTNLEDSSFKEKEESDGDDSSESEEVIEFNLGWEFIKNLESQFGNTNFQLPDGLFPAIQLKKSLAQEIYALWIDSMQQQMDAQQEQLDALIAKDAEFAKMLEENEAKAIQESSAPNLNEVMDMELALAVYKNDLKKQQLKETPNDMASRLTRQMLNEMFPTTDPETLSEILIAHNGNFKETVQVLEASTGQSLSSSDTLNKQNSLLKKVKQQSLFKEDANDSKSSSSRNAEIETDTNELTYEQVLVTAYESRQEAERQFLLRNENFNKASSAYRRGNSAVASYYSEIAKLHSKKMESSNAEAASAFLAAQTHILGKENTLDLHNLFVPEALQALDIYLDHQLQILTSGNKRSVEILIVTGRGARSNNNKSKIKPAVSKRLTSRNIKFTEANPGCLKAKLYRHNASSSS